MHLNVYSIAHFRKGLLPLVGAKTKASLFVSLKLENASKQVFYNCSIFGVGIKKLCSPLLQLFMRYKVTNEKSSRGGLAVEQWSDNRTLSISVDQPRLRHVFLIVGYFN